MANVQTYRVLRQIDVESKTGLSRSTIDRMVAAGQFPERIRLTETTVGFYEH